MDGRGSQARIKNPNLESVWNQNREQHGTVPGGFRQYTCGIALFFSVQHHCHTREDARVPLKTVLTDLCCPPAAAGGLVAGPLGTHICVLLCGMKCVAYNFCTRFCKLYHLCTMYNTWHSTDAVSLVVIPCLSEIMTRKKLEMYTKDTFEKFYKYCLYPGFRR